MKTAFLAFLFFTTLSSAKDADRCLPTELFNNNLKDILELHCETSRYAYSCLDKFKDDPDMKKYVACGDIQDVLVPQHELYWTCLKQFPEPLIDTFVAIKNVVSASIAKSMKNRKKFVGMCNTEPIFKSTIARMIPEYRGYSEKEISQLSCDALAVETEDLDRRETLARAESKIYQRVSEKFEVLNKQIISQPTQNPITEFISKNIDKYQCLNMKGKIMMQCYAFFSVFDPIMAASFASKAAPMFRGIAKTPVHARANKPIPIANSADSTVVMAEAKSEADKLKALGLTLYEYDRETALKYLVHEGEIKLVPNESGKVYYGVRIEVEGFATPVKNSTYKTQALKHSEFEAYAKKLKEMDVDIVVDTSIQRINTVAYYDPRGKVLGIRADSTWQDFIHEFQHAQFDKYFYNKFASYSMPLKNGRNLSDVVGKEVVAAYGKKNVDRLEELIKKDLPSLAVDETLAVERELAAMGWEKYTHRGSFSERYANRHQITALRQVEKQEGMLNPVQSRALEEAYQRIEQLETRDRLQKRALQTAKVGGAIAGVSALQKDSVAEQINRDETIENVYFDKKGNAILVYKDGSINYVRTEPKK